jgi:hypothetical protein
VNRFLQATHKWLPSVFHNLFSLIVCLEGGCGCFRLSGRNATDWTTDPQKQADLGVDDFSLKHWVMSGLMGVLSLPFEQDRIRSFITAQ